MYIYIYVYIYIYIMNALLTVPPGRCLWQILITPWGTVNKASIIAPKREQTSLFCFCFKVRSKLNLG